MRTKGIPKSAHAQAKRNLQQAIKLLKAVVKHEAQGMAVHKRKAHGK